MKRISIGAIALTLLSGACGSNEQPAVTQEPGTPFVTVVVTATEH